MMLQVIVYAVAVSALLSTAGFCVERLLAQLGWQRRWAWVAAMLASMLLPLAMMLKSQSPAVVAFTAPAVQISDTRAAPAQQAANIEVPTLRDEPSTAKAPSRWNIRNLPEPSGRFIIAVWLAMSSLIGLYLLRANWLLRRHASRWQRRMAGGCMVLVSDATGPALVGVLRPGIVVPHWFFDESAATQSLILEHEQQHILARDPLMLAACLLLLVLVPWNMPLWWQLRRMRMAIELDCDSRVLRSGADAGVYGKVLLTVTQRGDNVPAGSVAMGEPVSALEHRILNITNGCVRYSMWRVALVMGLGIGGFGAAAALEAPAIPVATRPVALRTDASSPSFPPSIATRAEPAEQSVIRNAARPGKSGQPAPANPGGRRMDLVELADAVGKRSQKTFIIDPRVHLSVELGEQAPESLSYDEFLKILGRYALKTSANGNVVKIVPQSSRDLHEDDSPAPSTSDNPNGDLRNLILVAGKKFRKNFVVDPRLRGTVDLDTLSPDAMTYHAFLEILSVHGFAAVPSGDVVTIVPQDSVRQMAVPIMQADDIQGDDAEVVTVVIPVDDAGHWNVVIRQLVPSWGTVLSSTDQKSLILVDRVANAKRIVALLHAGSKVP